MTPEERNYLKKQLGLSGGSPAEQRKIAKAKRPKSWATPKRAPKRATLAEQARRWWKNTAPAWLGGKAAPKRRGRRRRRKAAKGDALSPLVQTFLAGASVREATYRHRSSDPALMTAADWPAQVAAAEAAIRAHVLLLAEEIERLRAKLGAEETT